MRLAPFKLERIMSEWQNHVEFDLSSSGVDAAYLSDFLRRDELDLLWAEAKLRFIQTNGPLELREAISSRYPGATADNVLVTNGSSEALMALLWMFCGPGVTVAEVAPTYSLVSGLVETFGATLRRAWLRADDGWSLDLDSLERAVVPGTQLVYVGNPNNPTGSVLSETEREAILTAASRVGAWLVVDEIYHGAELDGQRTATMWGHYDRIIVTSSLSKAHGLAGLRLGWLVAPVSLAQKVWTYHDYTTTTTTALSATLATIALQPDREKALLDRGLGISRVNAAYLAAWVTNNADLVSWTPTKVGGFAFLRTAAGRGSERLAHELIRRGGVLVGPGEYFGADSHIRVGYSVPHLQSGLDRLAATLRKLNEQPNQEDTDAH